MISSMTGQGESKGEVNGVTYVVEIKSVNSRYLKTIIKLPDPIAFLEQDIDRLLRANLSRGTVNCVIRLKDASANVLFDLDEVALEAYMKKLSKVASSADIKCMDIGSLLALPGIIQPITPDKKLAEQIRETVLRITQNAVDQLKKMRVVEGSALAADLDSHCKAIKQDLERIRARCTVVLQDYQKKLKKRVDELLAGAKLKLDEELLAREVAIFAERSDISEEITRLDSHLEQFRENCSGTESSASPQAGDSPANNVAGRRLDFISQEMLREANTIGSKASDSEIAHFVVNIKCRIDRIKEQVQNIE